MIAWWIGDTESNTHDASNTTHIEKDYNTTSHTTFNNNTHGRSSDEQCTNTLCQLQRIWYVSAYTHLQHTMQEITRCFAVLTISTSAAMTKMITQHTLKTRDPHSRLQENNWNKTRITINSIKQTINNWSTRAEQTTINKYQSHQQSTTSTTR